MLLGGVAAKSLLSVTRVNEARGHRGACPGVGAGTPWAADAPARREGSWGYLANPSSAAMRGPTPSKALATASQSCESHPARQISHLELVARPLV